MRLRASLAFAIVAALSCPLVTTGTARAQAVDDSTRNTARDLAAQGKAAFTAGDMEKARDLWRRAYALVPAPTIAMYEGRALVKLNRFVEAEEAYMRAVRTKLDADAPEQFQSAVDTAEAELLALRPLIPKVLIRATGPGGSDPGLKLTIDGKPVKNAVLGVEMPIDPGTHGVVATAQGGVPATQSFTIAEKEHKEVVIDVPRGSDARVSAPSALDVTAMDGNAAPMTAESPAHDGSTQRTIGIAVAGAGVAGLAVGVITGFMAGSKHSDAETGCPERTCVAGTEGADSLDSFHSLRTVSTVGYVVGGLALAGGAVLYFTAPRGGTSTAGSVRAFIGANRVGVAGAF